MRVKIFDPATDLQSWNSFIAKGKNSTFLFDRKFMDYHSDRFKDYSLMIYDDKELVAVLPANLAQGDHLFSHQGLTYGGFVLSPEAKLISTLSILYHSLKFLKEQQIGIFYLKCFPRFYNAHPTDEIDYALFLLNAELYRRDTAFIVDQQNRIPYTGNIRREGNKALKLNTQLVEDDSFEEFWNEVLSPNLISRFGVKPVHSLEEIQLLKSCFPENIKQYNVYLNGKVVAGTTLFINSHVAHCQYISATEEGRKSGCLNYLFKHLLDATYQAYRYFDFGIVNEESGRAVNSGMLFWKESFGGRAHSHDFYKIDSSAYENLEPFIVKS